MIWLTVRIVLSALALVFQSGVVILCRRDLTGTDATLTTRLESSVLRWSVWGEAGIAAAIACMLAQAIWAALAMPPLFAPAQVLTLAAGGLLCLRGGLMLWGQRRGLRTLRRLGNGRGA